MASNIRETWEEYDAAAEWCARRGIEGKVGDSLPEGLSMRVWREIEADYDAFQRRIRETAYAIAMEKHED